MDERRYSSTVTFEKDTEPRVAAAVLKKLVARAGAGRAHFPERDQAGDLAFRVDFYAEPGQQQATLGAMLTIDDVIEQELRDDAAAGRNGFIPGDIVQFSITKWAPPEPQ